METRPKSFWKEFVKLRQELRMCMPFIPSTSCPWNGLEQRVIEDNFVLPSEIIASPDDAESGVRDKKI